MHVCGFFPPSRCSLSLCVLYCSCRLLISDDLRVFTCPRFDILVQMSMTLSLSEPLSKNTFKLEKVYYLWYCLPFKLNGLSFPTVCFQAVLLLKFCLLKSNQARRLRGPYYIWIVFLQEQNTANSFAFTIVKQQKAYRQNWLQSYRRRMLDDSSG